MTTRYLVLLRGINVGGRNKVPMTALRALLESQGHKDVSTYIASGNVILTSARSPAAVKRGLEEVLPYPRRLCDRFLGAGASVGFGRRGVPQS